MIKAPRNIPYFYNRASAIQLNRLRKTFQHFGVIRHQTLVGESLLRLGQHIKESTICQLPTDAPGKALFRMYKYYDSLEFQE